MAMTFHRFVKSPKTGSLYKEEALVNYPRQNLEMQDYFHEDYKMNSNHKYELYGVARHMGDVTGGHYIASAKSLIDNKWYEFNDSVVTQLKSEKDIVTRQAYVIFYRRQAQGDKFNQENIVEMSVQERQEYDTNVEEYLAKGKMPKCGGDYT